ncbi:hypothetical protein R1sor_001279 [Riccia sorocarpa]|uniref:Endonuclease/exonuclease/phosphatase domain-containing protein n=1 Tax=Riccia sorocarpa TaxID=122646 RepID=A0ABD3GYM0_9MARC
MSTHIPRPLQVAREALGLPTSDGIPPLAKVLLLLEKLHGEVIEVKTSISSLRTEVSELRQQLPQPVVDIAPVMEAIVTVQDRSEHLQSEVVTLKLSLEGAQTKADTHTASTEKHFQLLHEAVRCRSDPSVTAAIAGLETKFLTYAESFDSDTDLPGFDRVASVWNKKRFSRGRGYGGIGVWVRTEHSCQVDVVHIDTLKQFLTLHFNGQRESFLLVSYFAPADSPIYDLDTGDPFLPLAQEVLRLQGLGPVWLVGDFNSRIGSSQGEVKDGFSIWREDSNTDCWPRVSVDHESNRFSAYFLQFLDVSEMTILNGTLHFPDTHQFTFQSGVGKSALDFLLASVNARDRVTEFSLLPFQPDSDHRPLLFSISGLGRRSSRRVPSRYIPRFNSAYKEQYKHLLETRLTSTTDPVAAMQVVVTTAKEVLLHQVKRSSWFSEDCREARKKALRASGDEQHVAFRRYKNFIKGVKRKFVREHQLELIRELSESESESEFIIMPQNPSRSHRAKHNGTSSNVCQK